MNLPSLTALPALALAVTAFTALPAFAQTPASRTVSREELRACMDSEAQVTSRREAAQARGKQVAEERTAVKAEADALHAEEKELREDDYRARDRFTKKAKAMTAKIQAVNASGDALRTELEAVNRDLETYNQKCGGISYLPEDKAAILKEREASAKK